MAGINMKSDALELIGTVDVSNTLGEGVIWDHQGGVVWWTDIQECEIFCYHLASQDLRRWKTPARVGCMGFIEGDGRLVLAFDRGFAYFDRESGKVEWLACPEDSVAGTRFNDGRTDRQGRFWAGTMVEDADVNTQLGSLYTLSGDGRCDHKVSGITISNGLCFSPDSSLMYHSDSPLREIYVYDFDDKSGAISGRRLFKTTDEGCYPDGACVDSEGYLYSAQWGGSRVVRYTPEGEEDAVFPMPASQVSCVAFGGENLDLLFVTSAREDLSEDALASEPDAGKLFIFKTPFVGLREPYFIPE